MSSRRGGRVAEGGGLLNPVKFPFLRNISLILLAYPKRASRGTRTHARFALAQFEHTGD